MSKQNPQLEDGYTPIANDILEGVMALNLSREELLIVLAIFRQTYGWKRKEAEISLSQFERLTHLDRRNLSRAAKNLLDREIIFRSSGTVMKFGKPVYKYGYNKKHWCPLNTRTGVPMTPEASVSMTHNKTIKTNIKTRRKKLVDNLTMPN